MRHSLDYFDRIFIINLPSRADRRSEMAAQLNAIGLDLAAANIELFSAVRPDAADGFPTIGAKGCFMSHLGVLRRAQELGLQRVAIFEDDLDFAADFRTRIASIIEQLKSADWAVFYGGYHMERTPTAATRDALVECQPDEPIGACHFMVFQGEAILATVRYLEEILARQPGDPEGGPMHVDGAYNWFRRANPQYKTLLAAPELGFQRSSRTDIHDLRWFDTTPLVRECVAVLRLAKNALKRR